MSPKVNLACFEDLGERWYEADDDPVALLRAESRLFGPWLIAELAGTGRGSTLDVLDVGCGAGLLANTIGKAGHRVWGVDLAPGALEVARRHDATGSVRYLRMDACALELDAASFDAVLAMDLLEHVEEPRALVREAARVLRPGGRFFFHTFNRSRVAHLLVIKGVEWFVRNTPRNLHLYRLFIRPSEMRGFLSDAGLHPERWLGVRPALSLPRLWRLVRSGVVPKDFAFVFHRSLVAGYAGIARKPGA